MRKKQAKVKTYFPHQRKNIFKKKFLLTLTTAGTLFVILATLFLVGAKLKSFAASQSLYVSPSGSDTNDGSLLAPFRSITHAANAATPGTTVHVAPGDYDLLVVNTSGNSQDGRITFVSDVPGEAKIHSDAANVVVTIYGDYVDLQGFDVSGNADTGILLSGSYDRAIGNIVHDIPASGCTSNGGAGIGDRLYDTHDKDVIGNIVYNIGTGNCDQVHGIYHSTSGGHIFNNIVYNVSGFGIHLWHAPQHVVIANNLVFNNHTGGIVVGAGDAPGGVIANHILVENNIVRDNSWYGIAEVGSLVDNTNLYTHNFVFNNQLGPFRLVRGTQNNNFFTDPLLLNYQADGSGNYHLQPNSPAIGTGLSSDAPTVDIDNNQRLGAMDIGPYIAPVNLLKNSSFESGEPNWTYAQSGKANANPHGVDCSAGNATNGSCSLRIAVLSLDVTSWWHISEHQSGLSFVARKSYTLQFDAKTNNAGRTVTLEIGPNGSYGATTKTLSSSWQTFSYTFTAPTTDDNSAFDMYFGRQTGTVWIDNLSVTPNQ